MVFEGFVAAGFAAVIAYFFATTRRRLIALLALGLVLAAGVFLMAYLTASPDDPASCSDCGYYLGRWWEPYLVLFVLGIDFVFWCVGVALGTAAGRRVRARAAGGSHGASSA